MSKRLVFGLCAALAVSLVLLFAKSSSEKVRMPEGSLKQPLVLSQKRHIVYASQNMTIAVKQEGSVWTWGRDHNGRLARGEREGRNDALPGRAEGLRNIISVMASGESLFALDAEGHVWSWGGNRFRQLGYGTAKDYSVTPQRIDGLDRVVEMALSHGTTFFLRDDGSVWGVGYNESAMLGPDNRMAKAALTRVEGIPPMQRIAARNGIAAAIDASGRLWTWGNNGELSGRPGTPRTFAKTAGGGLISSSDRQRQIYVSPGVVTLPQKVVDVAIEDAVVALLADGTVWSWGNAKRGQLGRPANGDQHVDPVPGRIPGLSRIVQIAGTDLSFTAATEDGDVVAWGASVNKPTPQAPFSVTQAREPRYIKKGVSVLQLTSGGWGYLDTEGNWWSWGLNRHGTRGNGIAYHDPSTEPGGSYYLTPEMAQWNHFR
jgi:alpha-tubulin suppressor-like RCC1 family protein